VSTPTKDDQFLRRKQLSDSRRFLVDPIFPAGALHLFGGPSGAGKTTLLFQTLYAWDHGENVFGHFKSNRCNWVYVSGDRSLSETTSTLDRLGYSDWDAPCYAMEDIALRDAGNHISEEPTIFHVAKTFPDAELIVIEGLQAFLPNTQRGQTQNKADQLWMMRIRDQILNRGRTIIATTHTAKSKLQTGSMDKRNTFLGSAALIGACSTCVAFDNPADHQAMVTGKQPIVYMDKGDRLVTLMGRDFRDIELNYSRDKNGGFVLETSRQGNTVKAEQTPDDKELMLDFKLMAHPMEQEIKTLDLRSWAIQIQLPEVSIYKWLKGKIEVGQVEQIAKGRYRRLRVQ
jgi:hypothetical protein